MGVFYTIAGDLNWGLHDNNSKQPGIQPLALPGVLTLDTKKNKNKQKAPANYKITNQLIKPLTFKTIFNTILYLWLYFFYSHSDVP